VVLSSVSGMWHHNDHDTPCMIGYLFISLDRHRIWEERTLTSLSLCDNLLFCLLCLLCLLSIPCWDLVAPFVFDLSSLNTVDGISQQQDVWRVGDLVNFVLVLDFSDGNNDNTGTTSEHADEISFCSCKMKMS
jgi:hypothetical protein